jgi:hypothetical protein
MKIITNEKIIGRNTKIGFWSSLISPAIIALSMWIFFTQPRKFWLSLIVLFVGFILYQIGKIFRKWGRGSDLVFNKALEKLGKDYTLYHFSSPVSHLLVGPAGIWILVPRHTRGSITYNEKRNRWKLKHPTFTGKVFSPFKEGLERPKLEVLAEVNALDRYLQKRWKNRASPAIHAAVVFLDEEAEVNADNSPIPTLHIRGLREFIRKREKEERAPYSLIKEFNTLLIQD